MNEAPAAVQSVPLPAPLIVTATLPPAIFAWADALRRAHFPPERNFLSAHVTLFHALPPSALAEAKGLLAQLAGQTPPLPARVRGLLDLGRGTAVALDCPPLLDLRATIAERFHGLLSAQDRHRPRLHITIQNKVPTEKARALQQDLRDCLGERSFAFAGLGLHHYRGGPWEAAGTWPFRGPARAQTGG